MQRFRTFRRSFSNALAAFLLLALLSAQAIGLQHRIAHAALDGAVLQLAAGHADGDDHAGHGNTHALHSCELFDAAALGATLHAPGLAVQCERVPALPVAQAAPPAWHPLFVGHFSSRAPPFN